MARHYWHHQHYHHGCNCTALLFSASCLCDCMYYCPFLSRCFLTRTRPYLPMRRTRLRSVRPLSILLPPTRLLRASRPSAPLRRMCISYRYAVSCSRCSSCLVCTGGLLFMLFASRRCGSLDNDGCDWFRSVLRSDRAVTSAKLSGNDPIEGGHTGGADTSNSTNMSIPIDNATIADGASITYDSSVTEFASAESVGSLPEPSVVFTPSVMNLSTWSHLTGVCLDGLRVGCWEPVNITAEYSGEEQPSQEEKWSWMPQSQCPKAHIWPNLTAATPAVPRQSAVSCLPHRHFPSFLAQRCLVNRWIVFVGDSSTRFLYSAFVQLLSARREPLSVVDYHMPAYTSCPCTADSLRGAVDKRQCCANWYKGLEGNETVVLGTEDHGTSWFRERLVHTPHGLIRATFFFKTFADAKVGSFEAIITPPSQQSGGAIAHPDLVVLNTGAWDSYKKHNTSITVSATRAFVDDIRSKTTAPTAVDDVAALSLAICGARRVCECGPPTADEREAHSGVAEGGDYLAVFSMIRG